MVRAGSWLSVISEATGAGTGLQLGAARRAAGSAGAVLLTSLQARGAADPLLQRLGHQVVLAPVLDTAQSATAGLLEFQQLALSRLAAQHQEIVRLRATRTPAGVSDLDSARTSRTTRPR
jgi:hypothetical protein